MKDGHKSGLRPAASHCKIKPMKRGNHNMTAHPPFLNNLQSNTVILLCITYYSDKKPQNEDDCTGVK